MPLRMLRDWTGSDRVNSLTVHAERFFTRLIMKVDDYGCFYADARQLKANLYPLLLDDVMQADINGWLEECSKASLITLYENSGKQYLQIIEFGQKLDKPRSKFPLPDGAIVSAGGYVYMIGEEKSNKIKIGFSANPWARVKEVSAVIGKTVVLRFQYKGTMDDEKILTKLLRKYNKEKHWFDLNKKIITTLSDCYKIKMSASELAVVIRSNRSSSEEEVETELEIEPEKRIGSNTAAVAATHTTDEVKLFQKFEEFIKAEACYVGKMKHPFTIDQFLEISKKFNRQEIKEMCIKMHNYKPLVQKNISAYLTFLNWSKKDFNNRTTVVKPVVKGNNLSQIVKEIEEHGK